MEDNSLNNSSSDQIIVLPETEAKIASLEEIKAEASLVFSKLTRFPDRKSYGLQSEALNKWYMNTYHKDSLPTYDPLHARKLRTFVAGSGEQFMKLLLRLDQVQSEGNKLVKKTRKQIVKQINEQYLPLGDKYLVQAQALVTLTNKIKRLIKAATVSDIKTNETETSVSNSNSTSASVSGQKNEIEYNEGDHDADQVDMDVNEARSGDDKDNADGSVSLPEEVDFKVKELEGSVEIRILLPKGEPVSGLKIELVESESGDGQLGLLVTGKTFEQPFGINNSKYDVEKVAVKKVSQHEVKIVIPKVVKPTRQSFAPSAVRVQPTNSDRYSRYDVPNRHYQRQPQYSMFGNRDNIYNNRNNFYGGPNNGFFGW